MDQKTALEILYKDREPDLTVEGYLDAISKLREQSPGQANQVERALEPLLQRLFPRRQIAWHETSRGTNYRVALLPDNPHFQKDVEAVRMVLEIPKGQVRSSPDDSLMSQLGSWEKGFHVPVFHVPVQVLADRVLAGRWIRLHRRTRDGLPPDKLSEGLTSEAATSACNSASIDLSEIDVPEWLGDKPEPHPRCLDGGDIELPLHRATARLLELHRLPHHICGRVQIYVLTKRREDLERLNPTGVSIIHGPGEVPVRQSNHTFSVTIEGMDEYSTKAEWERVWHDLIMPHKEMLLARRGQRPQGRQAPDLKRLQKGLRLYRVWLETGPVEKALDELQKQGESEGFMESETARRIVNDLDDLFQPKCG